MGNVDWRTPSFVITTFPTGPRPSPGWVKLRHRVTNSPRSNDGLRKGPEVPVPGNQPPPPTVSPSWYIAPRSKPSRSTCSAPWSTGARASRATPPRSRAPRPHRYRPAPLRRRLAQTLSAGARGGPQRTATVRHPRHAPPRGARGPAPSPRHRPRRAGRGTLAAPDSRLAPARSLAGTRSRASTRLKTRYPIVTLSNGNIALMLEMAAARPPWDAILGRKSAASTSRSRNPTSSPRASSASPGELCLVAAHHSDLAAARAAGLQTAYVDRPQEYGGRPAPDADAVRIGTVASTA